MGTTIEINPFTAAASGDVVGPASSTDNAIARFDGTTGKLLQNSPVTVGDTGTIHVVGSDNPQTFLSVTVNGNATMGMSMYNGINFDLVGQNNPFMQFVDDADAIIYGRVGRGLALSIDSTDLSKSVKIRGWTVQTGKVLIVELNDATELFSITPAGQATFTTTTGALTIPRLTTTQRDALTPVNGMQIYNTSTDKFQGRAGGAWVDFH